MSVPTEKSAFSLRPNHLKTTTVYLLRPPPSHRPWVVAHEPPLTLHHYNNHHPSHTPRLGSTCLTPTWKNDDNIEKMYAVARWGATYVIHNYLSSRRIAVGKTLVAERVHVYGLSWRLRMGGESGLIRCRRRVAVDGKYVYLVVRWEERLLCVYQLMKWCSKNYSWGHVEEFEGNKVLFMSRDYCFFCPASSEFPGREFENCIVFTEAAFPRYGEDCWKFTRFDSQTTAVDIAFFRLSDKTFAREGETSVFPEIDWSTPPWIFDVPERELDTEDTDKAGEEDRKVHSDLKDSNSEDEVEQEGMESEEDSQDQEHEVIEVDSGSEVQDDGIIQCDSDSQEKEDDEMHSNVNVFESASLQEDLSPFINTVKASISAPEEEATITLLNMSDGNGATEKETSRKRKNNRV